MVTESNEIQGRKHLKNIERKLEKDPALKDTYQEIVTDQLNQRITEKAPEVPTGERIFYLPHKPVYAMKMLQQPKQRWYLTAVCDLLQRQTASTSVCTLVLHSSQIVGYGQGQDGIKLINWRLTESISASRTKDM